MNPQSLCVLLCAYVLGSIPFGYLIVKLLTKEDVRQAGSGSTGATNVTRKAGLKAGLATYVFDVAKGVAAVWLAGLVSGRNLHVMGAAGLLVVLGHIFPVFLKFRGGKGVATGVGVFLVMTPWPTLSVLGIWALIFAVTRTVSLGSILATVALPVMIWLFESRLMPNSPPEWEQKLVWAVVTAAVIVAKHYENIRRLLGGTEGSFKKKAAHE